MMMNQQLLLFQQLLLLLPIVTFGMRPINRFGQRKPEYQYQETTRKDDLNFGRTAFSHMFPRSYPDMDQTGEDHGEALFLTPLINSGKIQDAQKDSKVLYMGVESYSGYITVNESCGSNMFFWYFPPMKKDPDAPTLLWLQGGPGGASIFGLFVEHGPYSVDKDGNAHLRNTTWASKYGVLYVDNPVGTGFSFTNKDECYAASQIDVARDLFSLLQQFFKLFPNLQNNPFYIAGESYAGKYVPSISYKIHLENRKREARKVKIPFVGMAIGDGITDPTSMAGGYAPLLFQVGLLDENQRDEMANRMANMVNLARSGHYLESFRVFDDALNGDLIPYPSFFTNCTGGTNYFNYLKSSPPKEQDFYGKFLAKPEIRKLIHVGDKAINNGTLVEQHLLIDFVQGVPRWTEKLLDSGYRTLFYNGALDIIVGLPLTERLLWSTLQWSGRDEYRKASRHIWKVRPSDTEVAGYVRKAKNLYQVGVRNAGHILPYDQPEAAFDMIDRFIRDAF